MEVSCQLHVPAALLPGKEPPGTHWIGGRVGPRAGLDMVKAKVVSVLFLTEHHTMKAYLRIGGIAPRILDLGTRWR
jgi:hypothetical protein